MEESASARHITGTQDLLSIMSNEEAVSEIKKPHRIHWQQIFMVCCCILAIAAAGKGFLHLDTKISTVQSAVGSAVKDIGTLKAQVTATNTREQIAAVTTEMEDLKASNAQLRAEVMEIREAVETLKAKKNNVVPAQRKRR